nr:immunoglobulin heavy chain junction region [Mus musculus]MBK4187326.1 immunoglobulin heavy chain junction region [Mus musculus]
CAINYYGTGTYWYFDVW